MLRGIQRRVVLMIIVILFILLYGHLDSMADVSSRSIFFEAREPASVLDLRLMKTQLQWNILFEVFPVKEIERRHPLITKAGVSIELSHYSDEINATGWVTKLDGFLALDAEQRKRLVSDVLKTLVGLLFDVKVVDKRDRTSWIFLQTNHIKLNVIIGGIMVTTRGEPIRGLSPIGYLMTGQAGYSKGQFVYSQDYYLNLRVLEGKAVAGDATKFVIEKE